MRKLDSKSYIKYFILSLILGMIFISDFKIKDYYETKTFNINNFSFIY